MTHKEEQKVLFKNYLDSHVFKYWRRNPSDVLSKKDYSCGLELILTSACNTKCSYCYYKNFGDKTNPHHISNKNNILANLEKLLRYLQKEKLYPPTVDIFSGDPLNLPYFDEVMELLMKYLPEHTSVIIPTNGTFCRTEKKFNDTKNKLTKWRTKLDVFLSLSIDGIYLDNDTRPMRDGTQYTEEMYDRLFKFAMEQHLGFHPMIGPKGIDKWCDNLDWFIKKIKEVQGPDVTDLDALSKIYLLEVRNPDWTDEELYHLEKFCEHLTDTIYKACDENPDKFLNCFTSKNMTNLYSGIFSVMYRGMGCSIQQSFAVRVGDLKLVPCHRTSYEGFNACNLIINDDLTLDIALENPNLYMMVNSFNAKHTSTCCDCPINTVCANYCIGVNFEVNHDMFTPVESVCKLEYLKCLFLAKALHKRGLLDRIIAFRKRVDTSGLSHLHTTQLEYLKEKVENGI